MSFVETLKKHWVGSTVVSITVACGLLLPSKAAVIGALTLNSFFMAGVYYSREKQHERLLHRQRMALGEIDTLNNTVSDQNAQLKQGFELVTQQQHAQGRAFELIVETAKAKLEAGELSPTFEKSYQLAVQTNEQQAHVINTFNRDIAILTTQENDRYKRPSHYLPGLRKQVETNQLLIKRIDQVLEETQLLPEARENKSIRLSVH